MKSWRKTYYFVPLLTIVVASCNLVPPAPTATPTIVPSLTPIPTSISTNTPIPSSTPVPTPTNTQVVIQVEIRNPLEGDKVNVITTVEGTSQNIPNGSAIWLVVFLPSVQRYYPMNNPAVLQSNGEWTSQAYIGQSHEIGLEAGIWIVVADQKAQDTFNTYLRGAAGSGLEQLPDGAQLFDRISVVRK